MLTPLFSAKNLWIAVVHISRLLREIADADALAVHARRANAKHTMCDIGIAVAIALAAAPTCRSDCSCVGTTSKDSQLVRVTLLA